MKKIIFIWLLLIVCLTGYGQTFFGNGIISSKDTKVDTLRSKGDVLYIPYNWGTSGKDQIKINVDTPMHSWMYSRVWDVLNSRPIPLDSVAIYDSLAVHRDSIDNLSTHVHSIPDSTNFWRTKSDFTIPEARIVNHNGLSFFSSDYLEFVGSFMSINGTSSINYNIGGSSRFFANSILARMSVGVAKQLTLNSSGRTTYNDNQSLPLSYSGDYTTNMTNARDIPDIGYTDANYWPLSGNFSTSGNQTNTLGGTLTVQHGTSPSIGAIQIDSLQPIMYWSNGGTSSNAVFTNNSLSILQSVNGSTSRSAQIYAQNDGYVIVGRNIAPNVFKGLKIKDSASESGIDWETDPNFDLLYITQGRSNSVLADSLTTYAKQSWVQDQINDSISNIQHKSKKVVYDFAVDGGAVSTIASGQTLPDNAIVTRVTIDEVTTLTSSTNLGTIKLNLTTDGDISQALLADNTSGGVLFSSTTFPLKTTGQRNINFIIETEAITAGKVVYFIEYMISE